MMKRYLIVLLAAFLLVTGVVWAEVGYQINRHVVAGGSGHVEQGPYTLDYTIGQPEAGTVTGGDYTLGGGFWGGTSTSMYPTNSFFLPMVLN